MKNHSTHQDRAAGVLAGWGILLTTVISAAASDQFGDIGVDANAIYTGQTYHGYAETRVVLENDSATKPHTITLVYPETPFGGMGGSLSRLSRTVTLAPGTHETVSLLQPPVAAQGNGLIRVEVDGRSEGQVRAPNGNNHCQTYYSRYSGSPDEAATVLVSRSLDFNSVDGLFHDLGREYTADKATGPPDADSGTHRGNAWSPSGRAIRWGGSSAAPSGPATYHTEWLQLYYATAVVANGVTVYSVDSTLPNGTLRLLGASGTILATTSFASGKSVYRGSEWATEFSFPPTSDPVKTIQLEFNYPGARSAAIDAVQLSGPANAQWAVSARASSDASAERGASSPSAGAMAQAIRAEAPVSDWSENWLAYTPFDAIYLAASDLHSMPPAVQAAVGDYISAGGNVVIEGRADLPENWRAWQNSAKPDGTEASVGFGRCFTFEQGGFASADAACRKLLRDMVRSASLYWRSLPENMSDANNLLPVVESFRVPTRGFILIMLVFILVIGPVNMFVLYRCQRLPWMLATIPAISLLATVLVFSYSYFREGFTPSTCISSLTLIDQATHRGATIGGESFYCPLTPGGGLHFEYGTEVTPIGEARGSGSSRAVDWTKSQQLQRGWVSARVPAFFLLRKSETRRERIQILRENGKLRFVNGLGARVNTIWLADAAMNIYQASGVDAGQEAGLIPSESSFFELKDGPRDFSQHVGIAGRIGLGSNAPVQWLRPNTYIAVLDNNPFLENALGPGIRAKKAVSSSLVYGLLETPVPK